jgi:hypothetical protein
MIPEIRERLAPGTRRTRIGLAMNRYAGHLWYGASLWAGTKRTARMLETAVALVVAELRHLNGVGANASSHSDRVRIVKQTLARRGEGPNRCC